jgi:nucleoid-associated protein YgaU
MNTNVKVGIATAIVAALVALIVLDQKTTPPDAASAPPADPGTITLTPGAEPASTRVRDHEIENILQRAEADFGRTLEKGEPAKSAIKQNEERNEKNIRPVGGDEYVIKDKDTLESISQARYGSKRHVNRILEANPGLKPGALRVGKTLIVPPLPEHRPSPLAADPAPERIADPAPAAETAKAADSGPKEYTVAQGDTLMVISQKAYGTARHYKKIFEANRDRIADPNNLNIGVKLSLPDVAAAPAGTVATSTTLPSSDGKSHTVAERESLWKIAERYAPQKGKGILEMMQAIVAANPDKLANEGSLLRLGWKLVIPD